VRQLDQQLTGAYGGEHVGTHGLGLHPIGKVLGGLEVHVGVQQRAADLLHGLRHVDLRDLPLAFKDFERPFELIAEVLEHIWSCYRIAKVGR